MHFFFTPTTKNRTTLCSVLALIILLVSFSIWDSQPPSSLSSSVDKSEFSLPQAQQQLAQITQERHPIGSEAHDVVRDYLVSEIKALGLQPEVQSTFSVFEKGTASGQVQNIVVRLAGKNPTNKALLLVAHYDAVPNSFGAGDDGVSVISILQTLKALKNQPQLDNDVIVLLSDGEEAGLLGASGFVESHPWLKDVGMLLNFDNRGNSGPVLMFETSLGNGKLIAGLADSVKHPVSNSLMYEVYKALPNDTDFTVFRGKNIPGLNFAMIQNISSYHTRYDKSELISPASQQQQGEMMLKLTKYFGNQDLSNLTSENHVYFNFPLIGLIHYSENFALPLAGLIFALAMLVLWLERKELKIRLKSVFITPFLFLLSAAGVALLAQQMWNLVFKFAPSYLIMRDSDPSHLYLLAVFLLSMTVFFKIQKLFFRWFNAKELAFGAVIIWLLLLILTSWKFSGASFLFAWPILFVLLARLVLNLVAINKTETYAPWIMLSGSTFAILLFSPLLLLFNIALGFHLLGVPVFLLILLLGLLLPFIFWIFERLRSLVLVLVSVILIASAALATANFHQSFPVPSQLMYVAMPQSQQFYWMVPHKNLDRTNMPVFTEQSKYKTMPEIYGKNTPRAEREYWVDKAPDANIAAPLVTLISDQALGDIREIVLHISSPAKAASTRITFDDVSLINITLQGKVLPINKKTPVNWGINIHAMSENGVELRFQVPKKMNKPMSIHVVDMFYTLPVQSKNLPIPTLNKVDFMAQVMSVLEIP